MNAALADVQERCRSAMADVFSEKLLPPELRGPGLLAGHAVDLVRSETWHDAAISERKVNRTAIRVGSGFFELEGASFA